MTAHEARGAVCSCGWAPSGTHTARMARLLAQTHAETADQDPPAEDDR